MKKKQNEPKLDMDMEGEEGKAQTLGNPWINNSQFFLHSSSLSFLEEEEDIKDAIFLKLFL